jgi:TolB protein
MKIKALTRLFFFGVLLISTALFAQSGPVRDVRGRLTEKSSFEPTKIGVEEVRYVGINYITAADSLIMRECGAILRKDLDFSPYFEIVLVDSFFMKHMELQEMTLLGWKWLGSAYVIRLEAEFPGDNVRLRYRLFAADSEKEIHKEQFETSKIYYRALVHELADDIVKFLTGDQGIFRCKIAYIKHVRGNKELFISDYDGFDERQLTSNKAINISPTFSPDGEYIFFTSYVDGFPKIYMLTISDNSMNLIAGYPGINAAPAVSPDGKQIACVLSKDGNSEIYTLERKGKIIKRLTYSWAIESSPTWSPDGKEIAFTSDRTGSPQIYVMDAEGLNVRRLTFEGKYNDSPCWSPRGDRISYISRDRIFKIYSVDINGRDLRVLAEIGDNENPHFSPDGNHIIFSSTRWGQSDLYMMDLFGRKQQRITTEGGYSNPVWSPLRK